MNNHQKKVVQEFIGSGILTLGAVGGLVYVATHPSALRFLQTAAKPAPVRAQVSEVQVNPFDECIGRSIGTAQIRLNDTSVSNGTAKVSFSFSEDGRQVNATLYQATDIIPATRSRPAPYVSRTVSAASAAYDSGPIPLLDQPGELKREQLFSSTEKRMAAYTATCLSQQ